MSKLNKRFEINVKQYSVNLKTQAYQKYFHKFSGKNFQFKNEFYV